MKQTVALIITLFFTQVTFAQKSVGTDKEKIEEVVNSFMTCLVKKDSVKFFSLFNADPVVWVGVFKNKTQDDRLKKDSTKKNYFISNFKSFYRTISESGTDEEQFYNVKIDGDESIATVSFDYSFWENKKKINWGKEAWQLVRIKTEWKIASVIFSMDFETINPEPGDIRKK